ncbi:universal stress protein [Jatrophihabitans telluris]|uniref:Universal stress protein n=1 Tax=Jatrophihabitans telluris TaxID=2038343 RepID=A0ABY4QY09_9ACTN|nr:universal stress protein [Jatrophihabitans telluris]UQX88533.1 universal stress protein [Jatrophihabitans telluris]
MSEPHGNAGPNPMASPIVVGVSRRTGSPDAVRWAAAEAHLRDTSVVAVTAWRGPRTPSAPGGRPSAISPVAPEDAFVEEEERLRAELERAVGDLEALRISFSLRRGSASSVLLAAAVGAQLLVLDSPRAGGLATVGKSLIAPQVVLRSPCPVVLMPPSDTDPAPVLSEGTGTGTAQLTV